MTSINNFWKTFKKPIIGLAPMDGVTDAPFRNIVDIYGNPDVLFTEFIPADGIGKGIEKVLYGLLLHQTSTKTIAQLFGSNPQSLYLSTIIACEMGFDGVDINMGCPDKRIVQRGAGAGLINNPQPAQKCIKVMKTAASHWINGIKLSSLSISDEIHRFIKKYSIKKDKKYIPISVKTRIGYERITTESWISSLCEAYPDLITIHGRTFKECYQGIAHWNEIQKGAMIGHKHDIIVLGNGDIHTTNQAIEYSKTYCVDGVLIGRSSLGNPWLFQTITPTIENRIEVMRAHAKLFIKFRPDLLLMPMRKHFAWYCKGFKKAASIRNKITKVSTMKDLELIFNSLSDDKT